MNTKNLCGKTRTKDNPYEVWKSPDGSWTWAVLKKYQTPDKEASNPYARWFCNVVSPFTPHGEMGDVYVSEIKSQASKVPDTLGDDAAEQTRRDEKHGLYGGREDVAN
jgi:hypothetical protein